MHDEIEAALLERIEREGVSHCSTSIGGRLKWVSIDGSIKYGHSAGCTVGAVVTPAGNILIRPTKINRLLTALYRADHLAKNPPPDILAAIRGETV